MVKASLILFFCLISTLAQINLKVTAPRIPSSLHDLKLMGYASFAFLVLRVAFVSGLSLVATWVCYRKFEFIEFMVAQSGVYLFLLLAGRYIFGESLSLHRILAVLFILIGLGTFYFPAFRKSFG